MTPNPNRRHRDRGAVLPMVLVVSVVLSAVVVAVATYTAVDLRYGQVVEARAKRLAAAQGAMDDALEQLSIRSSLCATAAGSAGIDVPFPEQVNGADVSVSCRIVGNAMPPTDGWAIVVTGLGAPSSDSPTLEFTLGGTPEIHGPVFVHDPTRVKLARDTTIVEGDMWFHDNACAISDPEYSGVQYTRSSMSIHRLFFDPTSRGINCVNRSWQDLFKWYPNEPEKEGPPVNPNLASLPVNPAHSTVGSCRVFDPGYYTALPLDNDNYFRSGEYVFDNVGFVVLQNRKITMGQTLNQGYPAIDNTACDAARISDATTGATLYTRGNTRFEVRANGGFEVSGRWQPDNNPNNQPRAFVAVHVLDSSLGYVTPLMSADNGARKELAIQGLLWAPRSSFFFETVPAQKAAVLRGGAVVARFYGGVSAAASGFVIEVPTSPSSTKLMLESTATDRRGANTVRVIADYRPSTGEVAVNSRRVVR